MPLFRENRRLTTRWHDFGMEWKEHVGWLVPLLLTAVAFLPV